MTQLRSETHSQFGWCPTTGFGLASRMALVKLANAEITRLAQALPVVFRKNCDGCHAVAVFGSAEGARVRVSQDFKFSNAFIATLPDQLFFCSRRELETTK